MSILSWLLDKDRVLEVKKQAYQAYKQDLNNTLKWSDGEELPEWLTTLNLQPKQSVDVEELLLVTRNTLHSECNLEELKVVEICIKDLNHCIDYLKQHKLFEKSIIDWFTHSEFVLSVDKKVYRV